MLLRGGKARGRVTKHVRDNDGNLMGHSTPKPILDSRNYIVEFEEGTETELTANAITQSIYAQYDPDGNQYLMLDSVIDFCRRTTALCYSYQNFVKNVRTYRRRYTSGWQLC